MSQHQHIVNRWRSSGVIGQRLRAIHFAVVVCHEDEYFTSLRRVAFVSEARL